MYLRLASLSDERRERAAWRDSLQAAFPSRKEKYNSPMTPIRNGRIDLRCTSATRTCERLRLHKIAKRHRPLLRAIVRAKNSTGLTCRFSLVLTVYWLLSLPPPTGRSRWIHAASFLSLSLCLPSSPAFWFSFIRNCSTYSFSFYVNYLIDWLGLI